MKTFAVVGVAVVVVALVLTLGACSVKTSVGTETSSSTPPAAEKPAEGGAAPASDSGIKVVSLVAGDKFDEASKEITNETTSFSTDTPEIFVNAGITGLTTGAKISGALIAVDVTLADGKSIKEQELKSIDVEAPGAEATARFSFTPPEAGWPVGSYQVKVSVDGTEVDAVDLTVEKAQ